MLLPLSNRSLFFLMSFPTLTAGISTLPGLFANNQEKVLRPTVCDQMRFPRLIVVGMLWVAAGTAALPPGGNRVRSSRHLQLANVLFGYLATLFRFHLPIELQRMPIPAVPTRTLITSQFLVCLLQFGRRWFIRYEQPNTYRFAHRVTA